jgi:hypothetical protein
MRSFEALIVTAALAASLSAQTPWALQAPATSPTQRRAGACAFDAANNRLIFYGGVSATPAQVVAETWAFNGTWSLLPATTVGRWGHSMVRNTQNNRLITFGGRSPTISSFANDTYEWTGSAWATVSTANAPSARYLYGLAFDQVRNVAVLFGGRSNSATLGDVWEYNGTNWTQRTFPVTPPAREEMVLVYDPSLNRTVLFGGYDRDLDEVLGDTWHYDGQEWVEQTPVASPSDRHRAAAVYDPRRHRIVLFGGYTGTNVVTDTWEYTGSTWNSVAATTSPSNATETLHGYDSQRNKFVVFGGFGTGFSNQTWEYTGANRGFANTYGTDCPPPSTLPPVGTPPSFAVSITSNTPTTNAPWNVTYGNLDPINEFVIAAVGFSNTTYNGLPLPLDLALISVPGCFLNAAADTLILRPVAIPVGGTYGEATLTINVPNNVALQNTRVYQQALVFDFTPTGWFVGTSQGLRGVIGAP